MLCFVLLHVSLLLLVSFAQRKQFDVFPVDDGLVLRHKGLLHSLHIIVQGGDVCERLCKRAFGIKKFLPGNAQLHILGFDCGLQVGEGPL